ncbi:hypothetical protein VI817_006442 [Penicillium citrinum]|nr:hypothetical protein VI817_006442 [Penicillium citrinum]
MDTIQRKPTYTGSSTNKLTNPSEFLENPLVDHLKTSTTSQLSTHLSNLRTTVVDPYIITPLSTVLATTSTTQTSDIISIILLIAVLYISLRVLDYARRVILWWMFLVLRMTFWGTLVLVALYVYQVGLEKAGQDFGWVLGIVQGFVEDFHHRANAAAAAAAQPPGSKQDYRGIPAGSWGWK